jgi:S-adenosylmethionine:tRNA ribosyltransferase-isomerase
MDVKLFDFDLPRELIAQHPCHRRDQSRLLTVDVEKSFYQHKNFPDIISLLRKGDVLVRNTTKVIPARLYGIKADTNAHVEVLLLKHMKDDVWECLVGNARVVHIDTVIEFTNKLLTARCVRVEENGIRFLKFNYQGIFYEIIEKIGLMPLPPYIHEQLHDNSRYQTIYASQLGSVAGPTAGFHFTKQLFVKIKKIGVNIVDITLHIGLDTFRPLKVRDTSDHHMHSEQYQITKEAAKVLNEAKQNNRRIIAIGTTTTRALEANYRRYGKFNETIEATDIFITPGYEFKAVEGIITNFHLPRSTLIMMIAAFAKLDLIKKVYEEAIRLNYRFFSFGDSMFLYVR